VLGRLETPRVIGSVVLSVGDHAAIKGEGEDPMIHDVPETGSTNADLLAWTDAEEGTWLRADRQTAGRGRSGRSWQSAVGNLYASTIVRLRAGEPPVATLALVAAVALHEVASVYASPIALQLKWPNDLMAGAAKLAGILVERRQDAVVIGFGVNLAHHPEGLGRAVASLPSLGAPAADPAVFVQDLADSFARWLARWRGEGLGPVRRRWLDAAHPVGSALTAATPAGSQTGLFDGLTEDGALRLRRADGQSIVVHAGDVFLL
jgi:BirA family transcriptional regulator, biotin operon repressor / biotin---[acetyl-CoA-carboxylase] ligase